MSAAVTSAPLNCDELDPGIRDTVRRLRAHGFATTDSGDGVTKRAAGWSEDEALGIAHVFAVVATGLMVAEADRMQQLLGGAWRVEASYSALDRRAVLMAWAASS